MHVALQATSKKSGRLVTRVVRGGKKKRGKEQDEEELLQDKWTSWRPERVTDEGYATSEYISCSRVALYSMHESIYIWYSTTRSREPSLNRVSV